MWGLQDSSWWLSQIYGVGLCLRGVIKPSPWLSVSWYRKNRPWSGSSSSLEAFILSLSILLCKRRITEQLQISRRQVCSMNDAQDKFYLGSEKRNHEAFWCIFPISWIIWDHFKTVKSYSLIIFKLLLLLLLFFTVLECIADSWTTLWPFQWHISSDVLLKEIMQWETKW